MIKIPALEKNWDRYQHFFKSINVKAKTTLLREGEFAKKIYYIEKGCLRLWFNNNGKDITFQFFLENQAVSSIESFMNNHPSLFTLESIEPSKLITINKDDFKVLTTEIPEFGKYMQEIIAQRFIHYAKLFLSRIKDTPLQRYQNLLKENPALIQRIPQHYIASYLGITPVSLSRIRNKIK